jgi:hypothetical protein
MKCGRVKPLAYPVCAGKGSLNSASAIRQSCFALHPACPAPGQGRGPRRGLRRARSRARARGQTLRQSRILAPVARRGVGSVADPFTLDVPAGTETSFFASTAKSVS